MATRADICDAALSWVGTPYRHGACVCQAGVDCAMLLVGVAKTCELLPYDWRPDAYSTQWHLHRTEPLLEQTIARMGGVLMPRMQAQAGDIALMLFGRVESHAGILMPGGRIIHATLESGKVIHHHFGGDWHARWTRAYAFVGVC